MDSGLNTCGYCKSETGSKQIKLCIWNIINVIIIMNGGRLWEPEGTEGCYKPDDDDNSKCNLW
jgi:hypothetical protein